MTWNAEDAGISDFLKCGLRGSPTIVKKVFAPTARADKAYQVPTTDLAMDGIADALMAEIFKRQPALEDELMRFSATQ